MADSGFATPMANPPITTVLPIDAIKNIFCRLPFNIIMELTLVDKFCNKVISCPDFIKVYIQRCKDSATLSRYKVFVNNHTLIVQFHVDSSLLPRLRNIGSMFDLDCGKIVGSCNELICSVEPDFTFWLWNPLTGARKCTSRLVVEDRCVHKSYGFGYDVVNDDYKVVAFCLYSRAVDLDDGQVGHTHPSTIQVFSLKRNSWKSIHDEVFNDGAILGEDSSIVVNGKMHWFLNKNVSKDIVSFDIEKEVFVKIEQPAYGKWDTRITLGTLGGRLCVLLKDHDERMDLWVMKEYGVKESWTKIVSMDADQRFECVRPCSLLSNGKILLATNKSFVIYNEKNKSLEFPQRKSDSAPYYFEDQGVANYAYMKFDFSSLSRFGETQQKQQKQKRE